MVAEMSFTTFSNVSDSWDRVCKLKNHEEVFGVKLFVKFGTIMPEAMAVFGFTSDQMNHTDMSKNRLFISHAKRFVQMLGSAVGMLGPNLEMLTDILNELGQKHIAYGVKPAYFSAMGIALLDALESCDEKYTKEIEMSWREVYNAISLDMIRAYE